MLCLCHDVYLMVYLVCWLLFDVRIAADDDAMYSFFSHSSHSLPHFYSFFPPFDHLIQFGEC